MKVLLRHIDPRSELEFGFREAKLFLEKLSTPSKRNNWRKMFNVKLTVSILSAVAWSIPAAPQLTSLTLECHESTTFYLHQQSGKCRSKSAAAFSLQNSGCSTKKHEKIKKGENTYCHRRNIVWHFTRAGSVDKIAAALREFANSTKSTDAVGFSSFRSKSKDETFQAFSIQCKSRRKIELWFRTSDMMTSKSMLRVFETRSRNWLSSSLRRRKASNVTLLLDRSSGKLTTWKFQSSY